METIFAAQIEKLGKRKRVTLRDIRKGLNLSLAEFVSVIGVASVSQLSRIETGKTGFSLRVRNAYARMFPGIDLERAWLNTKKK